MSLIRYNDSDISEEEIYELWIFFVDRYEGRICHDDDWLYNLIFYDITEDCLEFL